jgi:hypothetical protein
LALLVLVSIARADRIDKLCNTVVTDPSWRVRLEAVVLLGRLRSERSVPALSRALSDDNPSVRALAAQVLGTLGNRDAIAALERATQDSNAIVRHRAKLALDKLQGREPSEEPSALASPNAVHIEIGGVASKVRKLSPEMTQRLREFMTRELEHTPGLTMRGKGPTGYLIDTAITTLNSRTTDRWVEITCEVSLVVGRLPSKAMVMMTSGGATVQAPKLGYRPESEHMLQVSALEGAVKGVHQNLLAFLKKQM